MTDNYLYKEGDDQDNDQDDQDNQDDQDDQDDQDVSHWKITISRFSENLSHWFIRIYAKSLIYKDFSKIGQKSGFDWPHLYLDRCFEK